MNDIIEVDGIFVEVDTVTPEEIAESLARTSGFERLGPERRHRYVESVFETIKRVCERVRDAFDRSNDAGEANGNFPDEIKVTFGLKVTGDMKIAFITKGAAEASLQIEAVWKAGGREK